MLALLLLVAVVNFLAGYFIFKNGSQSVKKLILVLNLIVNIGLLGYFKYTNFFITLYNDVQGTQIDAFNILLPLGISFYIFKALSYVFDIYYESLEPVYRFDEYLLYITFFGNIIAGPIDRATEFLPQVREGKTPSKEDVSLGSLFIISGLVKKSIIADYISQSFIARVFDEPLKYTGTENLIAVYGYAIQIFCDFSGYTDLAIGVALLVGYNLMNNFNYPYIASSVADFWRRWHISFSRWLLDYLFTPLQMGLRGLGNYGTALAILITFTICGMWHGASIPFIFWGILHGFYMSFGLLTKKIRKRFTDAIKLTNTPLHKFLQIFITFHLVLIGWVFFSAKSMENAFNVFKQIFSFFKPEIFGQFYEGYPGVTIFLILGVILVFSPKRAIDSIRTNLLKLPLIFHAILLAITIWLVMQIQYADFQPFIYFDF
ncbi:MAG: MBOAT family protein [Ignavibacteriaceae bacterium]|nr:MBOAT family protein [Ignavibacteriaceae bacterium]